MWDIGRGTLDMQRDIWRVSCGVVGVFVWLSVGGCGRDTAEPTSVPSKPAVSGPLFKETTDVPTVMLPVAADHPTVSWLADRQNDDGSWGSAEEHKSLLTGTTLLVFLGRGQDTNSERYGVTVQKAVQWLADTVSKWPDTGPADPEMAPVGDLLCVLSLAESHDCTRLPFIATVLNGKQQALRVVLRYPGIQPGWHVLTVNALGYAKLADFSARPFVEQRVAGAEDALIEAMALRDISGTVAGALCVGVMHPEHEPVPDILDLAIDYLNARHKPEWYQDSAWPLRDRLFQMIVSWKHDKDSWRQWTSMRAEEKFIGEMHDDGYWEYPGPENAEEVRGFNASERRLYSTAMIALTDAWAASRHPTIFSLVPETKEEPRSRDPDDPWL